MRARGLEQSEPQKAVVCLSMEMRTRRASTLTKDTGNRRPLVWLIFVCAGEALQLIVALNTIFYKIIWLKKFWDSNVSFVITVFFDNIYFIEC